VRRIPRGLLTALRYAWASPATLTGLALAAPAVAAGAHPRVIEGAIEFTGGALARLVARLPRGCRFGAITFGHVVICVDACTADRVRAHEQVHVRQYERFGVLFFPLYIGSSLVQLARGRDPYRDNRFEREAYARADA
jgi:hypothetical protein